MTSSNPTEHNQSATSSANGIDKSGLAAASNANDSRRQTNHQSSLKQNTNNTQPDNESASGQSEDDKAMTDKQPAKITPVDINISGKVYTINCPADEEKELKNAATFINNFIQDIRKDAPSLTHENLLVLCCLNLYEQMQQTKKDSLADKETAGQAHKLIDQMIKDMQVI